MSMVKVMEVDNLENPLTILGFDVDANFNRGLFTVGVTALGVGLRLVLGG